MCAAVTQNALWRPGRFPLPQEHATQECHLLSNIGGEINIKSAILKHVTQWPSVHSQTLWPRFLLRSASF